MAEQEPAVEQLTPEELEEQAKSKAQVDPKVIAMHDKIVAALTPMLNEMHSLGASALVFLEMPTDSPNHFVCSVGTSIADQASDRAKCMHEMCVNSNYANFVLELVHVANEAIEHAHVMTQEEADQLFGQQLLKEQEGPIFSKLIKAPNKGNVA